MKFIRERLGEATGSLLAPLFQKISHARQARTFHPDGVVFHARVTPLSPEGERLKGYALVRCSGALWKRGPQFPDALGVAVRFRATPATTAELLEGDQDLLCASIISPVTMPFSPFTTDVSDFGHNHFWAVSPFDVDGKQRVKFRLSATLGSAGRGPREERLRASVKKGQAAFTLELRPTWRLGWRPMARIELSNELDVDQGTLHFSAFNDGQGFQPRGFVHALRKAVYPASQRGRPGQEPHHRSGRAS